MVSRTLRSYFVSDQFAEDMKRVTDSVDKRFGGEVGESSGYVYAQMARRVDHGVSDDSDIKSSLLKIATTIAKRYHLDKIRDYERLQRALDVMIEPARHGDDEPDYDSVQLDCVARAFESLSSEYQRLIDARYSIYPDHPTMTALARECNCSRETAYRHVKQVLPQLRRRYEEEVQDAASC